MYMYTTRLRRLPDSTRFQIQNRNRGSTLQVTDRKRWFREPRASQIPDSQSRGSSKISDSEDQLPASVKIPDFLWWATDKM